MADGENELEPLIEIVERAENSLLDKHDDKYWATREEILLLASESEHPAKIYKDIGGNWVIEIVYSRTTFIHATSFEDFAGMRVQ